MDQETAVLINSLIVDLGNLPAASRESEVARRIALMSDAQKLAVFDAFVVVVAPAVQTMIESIGLVIESLRPIADANVRSELDTADRIWTAFDKLNRRLGESGREMIAELSEVKRYEGPTSAP